MFDQFVAVKVMSQRLTFSELAGRMRLISANLGGEMKGLPAYLLWVPKVSCGQVARCDGGTLGPSFVGSGVVIGCHISPTLLTPPPPLAFVHV